MLKMPWHTALNESKKTFLPESIQGVIDDFLDDNKPNKSALGDMIDAAEAGIQVATKQGNSSMKQFNVLCLEFFKALQKGDRESATEAAEKLVKAGHGEAFGMSESKNLPESIQDVFSGFIDYITSDIGVITLDKDWHGIKRIAFSTINPSMPVDGLKKGDRVSVEIAGGRKNPVIQKINKTIKESKEIKKKYQKKSEITEVTNMGYKTLADEFDFDGVNAKLSQVDGMEYVAHLSSKKSTILKGAGAVSLRIEDINESVSKITDKVIMSESKDTMKLFDSAFEQVADDFKIENLIKNPKVYGENIGRMSAFNVFKYLDTEDAGWKEAQEFLKGFAEGVLKAAK